MPDRPVWYSRLDQAIESLEALPYPWVGRSELEAALGVGRRRAQQILQPLVRHTIGRNGLASRDELIDYLRRLAAGQPADTENRRRQRLSRILSLLDQQARRPQVLVEAPVRIHQQTLEQLPSGVELAPGRIVIEGFHSPDEARKKLLALVLAMGNEPDAFDALITF